MIPITKSRRAIASFVLFLTIGVLTACGQGGSSASLESPSPASFESQMLAAIDSGDLAAVEDLLAEGVSPDIDLGTGGDPITPLHRAASKDQPAIIEVLIDAGATIDARVNGTTPLMMAAQTASGETVAALLDGGADPLLANMRRWGMTPIHYAGYGNNVEALSVILNYGVDIDIIDGEWQSAIFYAAMNGHLESVEYLVGQEADVNLADHHHATPLAWAVENGFDEVVAVIEAAGGHI